MSHHEKQIEDLDPVDMKSVLGVLQKVQIQDEAVINCVEECSRDQSKSFVDSIDMAMPIARSVGGDSLAKLNLLHFLGSRVVRPDDLRTIAKILDQPALSDVASDGIFSLKKLAQSVFQASHPSTVTEDQGAQLAWTYLRRQLLVEEPTTVVLGQITRGDISGAETLSKVLQTAIDVWDYNIARQPLQSLLSSHDESGVPGDVFIQAGIAAEDIPDTTRRLTHLQQMVMLVHEPDDLGPLISLGYQAIGDVVTADAIALTSLEDAGVPAERAELILSIARGIAHQDEVIWTSRFKDHQSAAPETSPRALFTTFASAIPSTTASTSQRTTDLIPSSASDPEATLSIGSGVSLTSMFKIRRTECCDCSSATGPAAYFVYLLQKLAGVPIAKESKVSLRDRLFDRRPDLQHLELSCANVKVRIPYIDLVNEILEAVLCKCAKLDDKSHLPYDMGDDDTSEGSILRPRNTLLHVYLNVVSSIVGPPKSFPYNQGVQSVMSLLAAIGLPKAAFFEAFRAPLRLVHLVGVEQDEEAILERWHTAKVLGLQHEDYMAITTCGIYTRNSLWKDKTSDEYMKDIGCPSVPALWGYRDVTEMTTSCDSLSLIQAEFLPRSGLSFAELLAISKSKHFEKQLIITSDDGKSIGRGTFVPQLKLRVTEEAEPSELDEAMCDRLQSFVRLKAKLGWSVTELDTIIAALSRDRPLKIQDWILDDLAAIQELVELTKVSPRDLQPLWTVDSDNPTESTAANVEERHTDRRAVILCKIMGMSPHEDQVMHDLLARGSRAFERPLHTWHFVQGYRSLVPGSTRLTCERLAYICAGIPITSDEACNPSRQRSLAMNATIRRALMVANYREHDTKQDTSSKRHVILGSLGPYCPGIDRPMLDFLLSVLIGRGQSEKGSGIDVLLGFSNGHEWTNFSDGYFVPPATSSYRIAIAKKDNVDCIFLDGTRIPLKNSTATTTQLIQGRAYHLRSGSKVVSLQWTSLLGEVMVEPGNAALIDEDAIHKTEAVMRPLMRLCAAVKQWSLEVAEVDLFYNTKHVNIEKLDMETAILLEKYHVLRGEATGKKPLHTLLNTLHHGSSINSLEQLVEHIYASTGWFKDLCASFIEAKYPIKDSKGALVIKDVVQAMNSISALVEMQNGLNVANRPGLRGIPMERLFRMAQPAVSRKDAKADFETEKLLRDHMDFLTPSLSPSSNMMKALKKAHDEIRVDERNALIASLLRHRYALLGKVRTADDLFDFLLIDVQMGPFLDTSRLVQATSAVQLFIQRCMLGLESSQGIERDALKGNEKTTVDWENMFRYRLWEANRKAFLYPENWADPTLRDDKTEQFQALEASLAQTKLSPDTIKSLIQKYVHQIDEIADLQVEAYLWDEKEYTYKNRDEPKHCEFHLFARTRGQPAAFYHRTLSMDWGFNGDATNRGPPSVFWTSWNNFTADVPIYEKVAGEDTPSIHSQGTYMIPMKVQGRLVVFLPEITPGQASPETFAPGTRMSMDELRSKEIPVSPKRWWNIRLGRVEFRSGRWAPKTVCSSILRVEPGSGMKSLPDIAGFKFWTTTVKKNNKSIPCLAVTHRDLKYKEDKETYLGRFEVQGQHAIVFMDQSDSKLDWYDKGPTIFSKVRSKVSTGRSDAKPGEGDPDKISTIMFGGRTHSLAYDVHLGDMVQQYFDVPNYPGWKNGLHRGPDGLNKMTFSNRLAIRLAELLNRDETLESLFKALGATATADFSDTFGLSASGAYHEQVAPFAIYSWELGVHIPSLLMERLLAVQQYELALRTARTIFDPRLSDNPAECWLFPPFSRLLESSKDKGTDEGNNVDDLRGVHDAARRDPRAYMKRIVVKYIEILVAHGDDYFRQATLESLPMAIERYTEASHIMGTLPVLPLRSNKPVTKSYHQLLSEMEAAAVVPVAETVFRRVRGRYPYGRPASRTSPPYGFLRTAYFCLPGNTVFPQLRDRIDMRLHNIRNGLDINGNLLNWALFEPPLDPGRVLRAGALPDRGAGATGLLSDLQSPMPMYRFSYVIQRAFELVAELRVVGQQLLTIKEKKDMEALSALRAKHQASLLSLTTKVKEHQKSEIVSAIESLRESRSRCAMRLDVFLQLTGDKQDIPKEGGSWQDIPLQVMSPSQDDNLRMSSYEAKEMKLAEQASNLNLKAGIVEASACGAFAIPNFTAKASPMGCGVDTHYGGHTVGQILLATATSLKTAAQQHQDESVVAGRHGVLAQQLLDRRLEANMLGRDLVKTDKDIAQLQARIAGYEAELVAHRRQIEDAHAEEEWLRRKYTSEQLYSALDNSMSTLFHQTYVLAADMAAVARRALDFEHAARYKSRPAPQPTIGVGLGQHARDGQLSGEALYLDLKQMELAHMENRTHDFEVAKTVSLRQLSPVALLGLRETGSTTFRLPEVLFDMDYPGHFCRRLSSVAMTVPCILSAYASISCTLTLTEHSYRTDSSAGDAESYCQSEGKAMRDLIPIRSIAVSSGNQDNGSFGLDFRGSERYGPFEGAGAISSWDIKFPTAFASFDHHSITDVILHLRFTAINGGAALEAAATAATKAALQRAKSSVVAIDLQNDFPTQWYRLASTGSMDLPTLVDRLPFWAQPKQRKVAADAIALVLYPERPTAATIVTGPEAKTPLKAVPNGSPSKGSLVPAGLSDLTLESEEKPKEQRAPRYLTNSWAVRDVPLGKQYHGGWLLIAYSITD
jgi:hypothetical protein